MQHILKWKVQNQNVHRWWRCFSSRVVQSSAAQISFSPGLFLLFWCLKYRKSRLGSLIQPHWLLQKHSSLSISFTRGRAEVMIDWPNATASSHWELGLKPDGLQKSKCVLGFIPVIYYSILLCVGFPGTSSTLATLVEVHKILIKHKITTFCSSYPWTRMSNVFAGARTTLLSLVVVAIFWSWTTFVWTKHDNPGSESHLCVSSASGSLGWRQQGEQAVGSDSLINVFQ